MTAPQDPENDPVWDLLGKASSQEAGPMFSRDVMREIRLGEQETQEPWWKKLLSPAPVFGTFTAAVAAVAFVVMSPTENPSDAPVIATVEPTASEQNLDDVADIFDGVEELDDLLNPMSLVASNDLDLQEFEAFLEY